MKYNFLIGGAALLLCAGCVSLVETAGKALDGSAFAEKKVAVYRADGMEVREMRSKAGETAVLIRLEKFPAVQLRGSAPDEQGAFYLTALDYLGGNTNGWNEYRLELSGSGRLLLGEASATLSIPDEIELVEITSGRIRRFDTRYTGAEAVSSLRNRHERVTAIAEWMNGREGAPGFGDQKEFEKYWKPILFPETALGSRRPEGWQRESDRWERAEDISWNAGYTERTFPEDLWGVRNSGTLLRDWEEAPAWIYVEYEWGHILEVLAGETVLARAKK